jgi:hypothetical protein
MRWLPLLVRAYLLCRLRSSTDRPRNDCTIPTRLLGRWNWFLLLGSFSLLVLVTGPNGYTATSTTWTIFPKSQSQPALWNSSRHDTSKLEPPSRYCGWSGIRNKDLRETQLPNNPGSSTANESLNSLDRKAAVATPKCHNEGICLFGSVTY